MVSLPRYSHQGPRTAGYKPRLYHSHWPHDPLPSLNPGVEQHNCFSLKDILDPHMRDCVGKVFHQHEVPSVTIRQLTLPLPRALMKRY